VWKADRQTDKHTDDAENPTHATTVGVGNDNRNVYSANSHGVRYGVAKC